MIGQILGNRYELIEKIGGGGMALVYKAKCRLLNRFVAVKVLKNEFANDDEFVKRFSIEAQAAASLSHPNIVSIYDVGHEENLHYIVMEYIDGTTLKEYIKKEKALDWKEAVNISIQICSAIEHAHRNGIIHRDIKPHNILLTKDNIVKVTDFGIARASSVSTITMVGDTIGSVHYLSPEQAKGGYIDERSDIYSLGIVMYEMLTGQLPFNGDSAVAVALQHIQREPDSPIEHRHDIPYGVNSIIMTAIKKDQNQRYKKAAEMLECLYQVLKTPDEESEINNNYMEFATMRVPKLSIDEENVKNGITKDKGNKKKKDKMTFWLAIATSSVVIITIVLISIFKIFPLLGLYSFESKEFIMGNYVGKNYFEVRDELTKKGVIVKDAIRKNNDKVSKDIILSQNRFKGEKIKINNENYVEFEVSDGPVLVKIPDVRNIDYKKAEQQLSSLGFVTKTVEESSDIIAIGNVIRTSPDIGTDVRSGSNLTIYSSKGPDGNKIKMPDLIGKSKIEALKLLSDNKLKAGHIYPEGENSVIDRVTKQDPVANVEVEEGASVNLYFETSNLQTQSRAVNETIALQKPSKYGDNIAVKIDIISSDTNKVENIMNTVKKKSDFPLNFLVPVPQNGNSNVKVYLDNKLYAEFTEYYS